ncbi:MAG: hypothetical protein GYB35_16400 [Algicola sp.]|nr:hypothetical protein [Algicola sp.]
MTDKEIILKRLALIKHLYKIGLEQSKQVETVASFSILSFHDSIEMFLKLLAEKKNIKSEKFNFLDYWTKIPTLTLKESMRNLNVRRVNIKHKGILPSKSDIELSRVNTTDFFNQNVIKHFEIEFESISLIDLVSCKKVKEYLNISQNLLDANDFDKSIENVSLAFDSLLNSYEENKIGNNRYSPFFFGKDLSFNSAFFMGIEDTKMSEFIDNVKDSLESMQKAIKIMSLGIDYKKFVKFDLLTPNVIHTMGGTRISQIYGEKKWTKENCQYCIDFVVDSTLKVQEFDFDIEEIVNLRWRLEK